MWTSKAETEAQGWSYCTNLIFCLGNIQDGEHWDLAVMMYLLAYASMPPLWVELSFATIPSSSFHHFQLLIKPFTDFSGVAIETASPVAVPNVSTPLATLLQ